MIAHIIFFYEKYAYLYSKPMPLAGYSCNAHKTTISTQFKMQFDRKNTLNKQIHRYINNQIYKDNVC